MLKIADAWRVLCALAMLGSHHLAMAQATPSGMAYPSKAIRWIVPYPAGASNDVVARLLAQKLTQTWGHPVVIDNRSGAGGTIGASAAARAAPDGYTLYMTNPGSNAINFALDMVTTYTEEDFTHVILLGSAPIMLSTSATFPAATLGDLIALAKAEPGKLTGGSSGAGGSSHFALELFKQAAQVDIRHIPYKGAAPAINDLIGDQISMVFTTPASVHALLQSGKLKALGVAGGKRLTGYPDVPTMAEQELAGFEDKIWFGVSVPVGTPREIVLKINRALQQALQLPDIQSRFTALGLETEGGSPERFSAEIKQDTARLRELIKTANIRIN